MMLMYGTLPRNIHAVSRSPTWARSKVRLRNAGYSANDKISLRSSHSCTPQLSFWSRHPFWLSVFTQPSLAFDLWPAVTQVFLCVCTVQFCTPQPRFRSRDPPWPSLLRMVSVAASKNEHILYGYLTIIIINHLRRNKTHRIFSK